jgi:hypothetical protein
MKNAAAVLDKLGVAHDCRIVSAHRTPDRLVDFAKTAHTAGFKVIIAGAGGAAHLPGMVASMTHLPVLGVPVESKALKGMDSLLDRADARRHSGGHAGHRRAGRDQCRHPGRLDPGHDRCRAGRPADRLPRRADRRRGRASAMRTIAPGATIGILGGGQLGRMMALAAAQLGYSAHVYAPEPREASVAAQVSAAYTQGAYDDEAALAAFARQVAVVTYEFENVAAAPLAAITPHAPLFPPARALEVAQDRVNEKSFVEALGGTPAPWLAVDSAADLARAVKRSARPASSRPAAMAMTARASGGSWRPPTRKGWTCPPCR